MSYPVTKRLFDIFTAAGGLLVLSPIGLLLALLVKLSDGGPVFYRQTRIGQFGKPFRIWKFRSMVVNADQLGGQLTKEEDPRITRIGRILRKTKLDELPQLWNVLVGEMSFVGPRPEVPRYVEKYTPEQREILKYKPGITDAATLLFRNEEVLLRGTDVEDFYLRYCLPKKIMLNREHAEQATLVRDVWIILQTIFPYWAGVLLIYCIALSFSLWLAYELRSDFRATREDYQELMHSLPLVVLPQLILLVSRGQLRGLLSYFSIPEMRRTFIALAAALVIQAGLSCAIHGYLLPPRGTLLMDFVLSFFVVCGVRVALRLVRESTSRVRAESPGPVRRVALIGTGELATNLALDFARSGNPARKVVAFFDDDPHAWHKRPHDIPVVGMPECLLKPEWQGQIDEVIVTLPETNAPRIHEIGEMLKHLPLQVTVASGWPVVTACNA